MLGGKARPDTDVASVKAMDFDAVVFVGGSGATALAGNETVLALARSAYSADKLVAAICIAPLILANAGLLKDRNATSWDGVQNDLKTQGARVAQSGVMEDGRIITASGPEEARRFADAIARKLAAR
jgi:protease I